MEIFEGIHHFRAELIMSDNSVGLMMLGVVREEVVVGQEFWIADIQVTPIKKFKLPKEYRGYRADQLLTSRMDLSTFEEIK